MSMNHLRIITWMFCLIPALFLFAADAQFVGAPKCMMCHKSERRGNQWDKWSSGPHAKAFETLKSEQSKKIAADMGIADPTTAEKCLKCHVTGHGSAAKAETFSNSEGVTCEACHGPGSVYKSMKVMKALADGSQDAQAVSFMPGDAETCRSCHNPESPTYRPFDYDKKWALIDHSIPQ